MPQFYKSLPVSQGTLAEQRRLRMNTRPPVGIIADQGNYSYGFDGNKYWVAEGVLQHLMTGIHLTFDEAKMLYDALQWNNNGIDSSIVNNAIRAGRKAKHTGQTLFWFYVDSLNN